jgi:MFS family permease
MENDLLPPARKATRLIFLMSGISLASWAPMVPFAKARLGLDEASLGTVLLALGCGAMVAMPLAGFLSQRFGNRRTIGIGAVLICVALPWLTVAPDRWSLAAMLLFFGAVHGVVDVAMNAHAVDVERMSGGGLMSGFHGLFSVGGLLGSAFMSVLLTLGAPLFACALVVAVVLAVVVLTQWRHLLEHVHDEATARHSIFQWPSMAVIALGVLCCISFLAEGSMLDWSAVFLRSARQVEVGAAGFGYAAFSVAMAGGRLLGDRIVARFGPVNVVRLGALLAAAGFFMATGLPWAATSLVGFLLVGIGAANIVPVLFSAAGRQRGTAPGIAIATVTTLGYAGMLAGPAAIGYAAHATSLPLALSGIAVLLLGVAAMARLARR